jgi:hypothetical protein
VRFFPLFSSDSALTLAFLSAPFPLHFPPDSLFFESRPRSTPPCSPVRATSSDLTRSICELFASSNTESDHCLGRRARTARRTALALARSLAQEQKRKSKGKTRERTARKGEKLACSFQLPSLPQEWLELLSVKPEVLLRRVLRHLPHIASDSGNLAQRRRGDLLLEAGEELFPNLAADAVQEPALFDEYCVGAKKKREIEKCQQARREKEDRKEEGSAQSRARVLRMLVL